MNQWEKSVVRWLVSCRLTSIIVLGLLTSQTALLGWQAWEYSPTLNEPALLAAGISHWQLGRYELYRVNPPLVRVLASLPVLMMRPETDWRNFILQPRWRPEYVVGSDFIAANGVRSVDLLRIARLACIPFSIIGAIVCFLWARDLYGTNSGLGAMALWCFCPLVLGHGCLITNDVAAATLAVAACYSLWRWLRQPTWGQLLIAGIVLGVAQLTKSTLIILYPVFLSIAAMYRPTADWKQSVTMLVAMLLISIYVLNAGYLFHGSCRPLGQYEFISIPFKGKEPKELGNRFANTLVGNIPVPLPMDYVLGIDEQCYDFEAWQVPSYLRSKFRLGGWYCYYFYGLVVKTPLGTLILLVAAIMAEATRRFSVKSAGAELAVIVPAITILLFVSAQTGFNAHIRYAIPVLPFASIWCSRLFESPKLMIQRFAWAALVLSILSSLLTFPHSLSYFNEVAGGADGGPRHLLGSNVEWGQDLLCLKEWSKEHPTAKPLFVLADAFYEPEDLGINCINLNHTRAESLEPGWYAVGVNELQRRGLLFQVADRKHLQQDNLTRCLNGQVSIGQAGTSIIIFKLTQITPK